jgi:hypothetical protein
MEAKSRTARKTPAHIDACELKDMHPDKSKLEIYELDGVVGGASPTGFVRKHLAGVKYE